MSSLAPLRRRLLSISRRRHIRDPFRRARPFQLRIGAMVTFRGKLTPTPGGGGGCLVPVPREGASKLGLKGMPKVQCVIAGQPYRGSLMPMGDGTYCLGVLKSIQEAAGVKQGDTIEVLRDLDTAPQTAEPTPR